MCGIAGVIAWDERYRVTRETLQRMSDAIAHRGPDGEGYYLNHEQEVTPDRPQCGFAFRRLAILDPDPRAMQPFTIGDKTIVFNGEIYNFRELREELKKLRPDYSWRTTGDTEVLLLAYDAWGDKCVERLNGMYALAIWEERSRRLFIAGDRMGQKPLYTAMLPGRAFAFGSELSVFGALPWVDRSVVPESLRSYLRFGYVVGAETIYRGVENFPRAGRGYVEITGPRLETYFRATSLFAPCAPAPDAVEAPRRVRHLVRQAVARQLVSDVPLGCFLSGGVDSSVVAASMKAATQAGQRVLTFSIGFDDPAYDETEYAARVAAHLGTEHHRFKVHPNAAEDLPKLAAVFGEPFADSSALPTHYLSRETRRHVKVALSGDGGDELFGGYDRYRALAVSQRVPAPLRHALAAPPLRAAIPGSHPKSRAARAKRFLSSLGLRTAWRYASYLELFDEPTTRALMRSSGGEPLANPLAMLYIVFREGAGGMEAVPAALATDRASYLPGDLLAKVDRASMLHGLEVRSPFMDHELVQFAAGLTTNQLLKGGPKRMLREAFADDLPAWVFKRKKMGFAVPIGEWFRGELRPMLRDHLFAADAFGRQHFNMSVVQRLVEEHEAQKVDHSQRLYALLMLELWWRTSR